MTTSREYINFINTGSGANAGNGDSLRTAFNKINANFQNVVDNFVAAGVSSFNSQTGFITFTGTDIVSLLGFTPYPDSNPQNYVTSSTIELVNYATKNYVDNTFVSNTNLSNYNYVTQNYVDARLTEYPTLVYLNNQGFIVPATLPNFLTSYATLEFVGTQTQQLRESTISSIDDALKNNNLVPNLAATYNLGDEAYTWGNLYLGGAIYIQGIGISVDQLSGRLYVNGNNVTGGYEFTPTSIWNTGGLNFTISSSQPNPDTNMPTVGLKFPADALKDTDALEVFSDGTGGIVLQGTSSTISIDRYVNGISIDGDLRLPLNLTGTGFQGSLQENDHFLQILPNQAYGSEGTDLVAPQQIASFDTTSSHAPLLLKGSRVALYASTFTDAVSYGDSNPVYMGLDEDGLYVGRHYTRGYGEPTRIDGFEGYRLPVTRGQQGQVLGIVSTGTVLDQVGWITAAGGGGGSSNQLVNGPYDVTLDVNGNTTFPSQTYIRQNSSYTRTVNGDLISGVPTVIWSGTNDNITSVKMTIQVEGFETGDDTGWHTQTCEAVIAERYWGNLGTLDPTMSVYGVVHTSVAPLATFSVQRNPTTHVIEVVATPTSTADTLRPKVHSVEMLTRD